MSVSACVIAHNEAANIERTLRSLAWADEIVVVDCASEDDTAEIARRFTDLVQERDNLSNLNINKNFSFEQAKSDWIICIDADEVVGEKLAAEIMTVTEAPSPVNGYFIPRRNFWFGRPLMHGGHYPDRQLRLFRRGKGRFPEKHVHERLSLEGRPGILSEPMDHYPYPTISTFLAKMDFYTTFEAEQRYGKGARFSAASLIGEVASAKFRFFRRYLFRGGFRDGWQGFAAAYLDFLGRMVIQLKIREMDDLP
jgi:glycosyltransferase involved in cell wall biosynthesis